MFRSNRRLLLVENGRFPCSHDSVLPTHSATERAVKFSSKGQLGHVGDLLLAEYDTLLRQGLVLHAVESFLNVPNFGGSAICRGNGGSHRRCHAESTVTDRGTVLPEQKRSAKCQKLSRRRLLAMNCLVALGGRCGAGSKLVRGHVQRAP